MSNEQVILEMVVNRLSLLLEAHEELKAKWSAEITEIILLGKGVLTPESAFDAEGRWPFALSTNELDCLSDVVGGNNSIDDWNGDMVRGLLRRLQAAFEEAMLHEANGGPIEPENEDIDDEDLITAPGLAQDAFAGLQFHIGVDMAMPEMPNDQA